MIRKKNLKPVGMEYTAVVKSTWKSLAMWWYRLLGSAALVDILFAISGQGAIFSKYLGEHTGVILLVVSYVGMWLRKRTTSAVK